MNRTEVLSEKNSPPIYTDAYESLISLQDRCYNNLITSRIDKNQLKLLQENFPKILSLIRSLPNLFNEDKFTKNSMERIFLLQSSKLCHVFISNLDSHILIYETSSYHSHTLTDQKKLIKENTNIRKLLGLEERISSTGKVEDELSFLMREINNFLQQAISFIQQSIKEKSVNSTQIKQLTSELEKFQDLYNKGQNQIIDLEKRISKLMMKNQDTIQLLESKNIENSQLLQDFSNIEEEKNSLKNKLLIMENAPITQIYTDAHDKYSTLYASFTKKFYVSIIGILICLALILYFKAEITDLINTPGTGSTSGIVEFWILKISLMLIGVTLASYFLKQASHYQRLSDQHHQTAVELKAYPSFMNSVPLEEAVEIRKELALKYFGREIDASPHKDMSNLISDQLKSTTEMVKATTDAIKNLNTK